jgi:enamine deaminase RidA (YjgF/YER057c/UK114 family)
VARQNVSSNSPFEPVFAFSRAVRVGNSVSVSGTVGRRADGTFPEGVYEQARQAIENIAQALSETGCSLNDVVRTRVYLVDIDRWEDVARAHREAFADVRPASTMVEVSRLAAPEMLVEIEADAIVSS